MVVSNGTALKSYVSSKTTPLLGKTDEKMQLKVGTILILCHVINL